MRKLFFRYASVKLFDICDMFTDFLNEIDKFFFKNHLLNILSSSSFTKIQIGYLSTFNYLSVGNVLVYYNF